MKILITGCAGFLGAHLTKSFLDDGHSVIGVDNFYSSSPTKLDKFKDRDFVFFENDVCDLDLNHPLYASSIAPIDLICNLACPASPPVYQRDHEFTLRTSIDGIRNAIDLALYHNAKLFHTSTSEVYGDPDCYTQSEQYWGNVNPYGERSCYDEGKRVAESFLYVANKYQGVDTRIARIFNTYGPGMDPYDGRVVSNFIMQALQGKPITVYGDGSQTRALCFVDDMILGFRKLIDSYVASPVNLGNRFTIEIGELAEIIKEITGSSSEIVYTGVFPADDPKQRCPDITKAKIELDWSPRVSMIDGLEKTVDYFKEFV